MSVGFHTNCANFFHTNCANFFYTNCANFLHELCEFFTRIALITTLNTRITQFFIGVIRVKN